jgi:hypothetical protein
MGGAVPPLPQYAFMSWCSVRGSTGTGDNFMHEYVSLISVTEHINRVSTGIIHAHVIQRSRDSSVSIVTKLRAGRRPIPGKGRVFPSPQRPDRLWGPHSLLCNGYGGLFPRG